VRTDARLTGIGSSYTSADLVRTALGRPEDLYLGEMALEGGVRAGRVLRK
jgi:hypothetical protein